MLDGLLGRGFSAKCKSLIKVSRTRLDAIKRKRNAMLKYLKKDVADLLSNGLDINAYGRAEGLYNELNLSSCYDTVEQYCELIPKHLSVIQKQRECPEECREAISSLMFAAARFADLPELRDLRDTFTERFGNSLEPFVNKELVEKLASKPPSVERKLQLMRDIAQEFSIKWDSKAFQQKLASPLPTARDQPKTYGTANEPKIDEKKLYNRVDESAHKRNNVDVPSNGRRVVPNEDTTLNTDNHPKVLSNGRRDDGKKLHSEGTEAVSNNRDVMSRGRRELGDERYRQQKDRNEPILESNDGYIDRVKPHKEREHAPWKRETRDVLLEQEVYIDDGLKPQRGTDDTNSRRDNLDKNSYRGRRNHDNVREVHNEMEEPVRRREKKDISSYREVHVDDGLKAQRGTDDTNPRKDNLDKNSYRGRRNHDNEREVHDNEMDEPVRRREKDTSSHREHESPTIRQKMKTDSKKETPFVVDNYKTANNLSSKGSETIRKPLPPPPYLKPNTPRYAAFESNIPPADTERNHNEEKVIGTSKVNGQNNLEHQDVEKKPKPKSVRRRHMRPPPRDDNEGDEADVSRIPSARRRDGYEGDEAAVRRIPSARRREEKQGLQHALDGDRSTSKDEEERMMDKLLLHYSKKPTAFEPRNIREGRVNAKVSHHDDIDDAGEPQHRHRRKHKNPEPPSRATSLPPDPVTPTESERGPARANSFQPDMYNAGGHVHPRLPDYDDIHARFAALKGR